ncbi:hypothetical protein CNEO3_790017 [Clostridium neonatale]|nr:hypothetical protein CNEO3_790017 [Clostridium neonatale]
MVKLYEFFKIAFLVIFAGYDEASFNI